MVYKNQLEQLALLAYMAQLANGKDLEDAVNAAWFILKGE
jgi:hypothetical protein